MTFVDMFSEVCRQFGNAHVAERIGISVQYASELRRGTRMPSVRVVDSICDWMGRGPKGRIEWHRAGARAHGWNI